MLSHHGAAHSPETTHRNPARTRPLEALLRLGNLYELDFDIDPHNVNVELEQFEANWQQYNPYKPENPRKGLSVTSLDGGLSGKPDLYSLQELYRREGTLYKESDFRTLTPVYDKVPSIRPLIDHFHPFLGRTHFLRFQPGGYFPPHRDGAAAEEPDTFRVLVPIFNVNRERFVFLYNNERITLEKGAVYFINTLVNHSIFSFGTSTIFVANVLLNHDTVARVKAKLAQK